MAINIMQCVYTLVCVCMCVLPVVMYKTVCITSVFNLPTDVCVKIDIAV